MAGVPVLRQQQFGKATAALAEEIKRTEDFPTVIIKLCEQLS
jgi:hypothetical protein